VGSIDGRRVREYGEQGLTERPCGVVSGCQMVAAADEQRTGRRKVSIEFAARG
jgi:hypothetical protein